MKQMGLRFTFAKLTHLFRVYNVVLRTVELDAKKKLPSNDLLKVSGSFIET